MHCQLEHLARCLPGRIRHALDELPLTLDATYERTLQEIDGTNWEFASRLLHCVAVASRPLRVKELAEFLVFDFHAGDIPKYREDWRPEDPIDAVLSTCSTLLSLVNAEYSQVIQFSHFSVKEFLTSSRLAEKCNTISRHYHVSMTPAHAIVAKVCLGILLHLDKDGARSALPRSPLAEYAAEHWFEHARFQGVSQTAREGMLQMFDRRKPHLMVWLSIRDPTIHLWERDEWEYAPLSPHGTPLHYAGFCGLYDVVKVLVTEYPQDVDSRSFIAIGEETPLHLTTRAGHIVLARLLIEYGADVAAQSKDGSTPLHLASECGHVDLTRLFIEHGADVAAQSKDGTTPLHRAIGQGHADLIQLLIEHGAYVGSRSKDGTTPLHLASGRGHVDLARLFIEHGADVAARSKDGTTPLHLASRRGNVVDLARLLIEHGADAAARRKDGTTPLHGASAVGDVNLAQLLIEHGADAAARSKDGTPLFRACLQNDMDMARFLISHGGADVAGQNMNGMTPLHAASEYGNLDLARLLIEHGADAAAQSKKGLTPLHGASLRGRLDMARLLIEYGADVAAQSKLGTPLHWACEAGGDVDMARLLIEHGADVAAQSERGTPLQWASSSEWGYVDQALVRLLIEHGADTADRIPQI